MRKEREIGICIGDATPVEVLFVSKELPKFGEYVILEYNGMKILGMISYLVAKNPSLNGDMTDFNNIEELLKYERDSNFILAKARLLGDVESMQMPRIPPPPGTKVYRASKEILQKIFSSGHIKIGKLVHGDQDIDVYIDAQKMVCRHLAILAITGSGKSNTVCVISEELTSKLNGTVLIFDMHSEYVRTEFSKKKIIEPKINPMYLSFDELKILLKIDEKAHVQERVLREAYNEIKRKLGYINLKEICNHLEKSIIKASSDEKRARIAVLSKLEDFIDRYKDIFDENSRRIIDEIQPGHVNVIDLGEVDENVADVIVSHVLRNILNERKTRGTLPPIFCVIEEAHILAPKDDNTLSKYWISRIAREGRKFGIGICLVSQRPKSLDPNALSQCNNMIIMRLVEPSDQKHVQHASERLSDDLLVHLPSLNIGEAVVLGLMIKVPALVKIYKYDKKLFGGDPDIIEEWKLFEKRIKEEEKDEMQRIKELDELYNF